MNLIKTLNCLEDEHIERLTVQILYDNIEIDSNGCHIWQGCIDSWGYGRIYVPGFGNGYVHRVALALDGVDVDAHEVVRHRCNNPACCNKHHLSAGTQKENVADMWKAGNAAQQKA